MQDFFTVNSYVTFIESKISLLQYVESFFHLKFYEKSKYFLRTN